MISSDLAHQFLEDAVPAIVLGGAAALLISPLFRFGSTINFRLAICFSIVAAISNVRPVIPGAPPVAASTIVATAFGIGFALSALRYSLSTSRLAWFCVLFHSLPLAISLAIWVLNISRPQEIPGRLPPAPYIPRTSSFILDHSVNA